MDDIDHAAILRQHADTRRRGHSVNPEVLRAAADEIERLRAERDEARRSVCQMSIQLGGVYRRIGGKTVEVTTAEGCAEIMRWDCFKGETP